MNMLCTAACALCLCPPTEVVGCEGKCEPPEMEVCHHFIVVSRCHGQITDKSLGLYYLKYKMSPKSPVLSPGEYFASLYGQPPPGQGN